MLRSDPFGEEVKPLGTSLGIFEGRPAEQRKSVESVKGWTATRSRATGICQRHALAGQLSFMAHNVVLM
jgi:hypothetical protein